VVVASGWKIIFAILAALGVINLVLVSQVLPTAYVPDSTFELRVKPILENFKAILKIRQFTIYTLVGSLSMSGLFVYVAGSPSIFMEGFHLSAKAYGAVFALLAVGIIGGTQLNHWLIPRFGEKRVFSVALCCQTLFSFIFLIGSLSHFSGLVFTVVMLFCILSSAGASFPNTPAIALAPIRKNIGSASSLMGFLQLGIGSLVSSGIGLIESKGGLSTAAVMSVSSMLGVGLLVAIKGKQDQVAEIVLS
jgi:DHA1 family bicyclomycin/chloramphenicol resistance-like MFS transporter